METSLAALHADLQVPGHGHGSSTSPVIDGAKDIVFGSIAGMVSKVFEHPFDLCKVRLQAQVLDHTARFTGPVDCLTQTWKEEGVRGLYRGLPAPIVGAMAENATLFLAYGQLQHALRWTYGTRPDADLSLGKKVLAAAGAGTVTSFLLTPIELVKCKMQVQMLAADPVASASKSSLQSRISALPGPIQVLKTVVRTHGMRGLWLGQTGTLIRETGGGAAWFGAKEAICDALLARRQRSQGIARKLTRHDLKEWESALAGAIAGIAYNVVLFPADTVKSALQTEEELRPRTQSSSMAGHAPPRPSFLGMARAMYSRQGVRGLYAGMGITVARAIPSSAMIFLIYDGLSKRFS